MPFSADAAHEAPREAPKGRWLDRRFLGVGTGAGLIGGICCIGSALAIGAGIGGLSFFSTWMDRYQTLFIAGSGLLMVGWLIWIARRSGFSRRNVRPTVQTLARHTVVMGVVYAVTLGVAMIAARLAETV